MWLQCLPVRLIATEGKPAHCVKLCLPAAGSPPLLCSFLLLHEDKKEQPCTWAPTGCNWTCWLHFENSPEAENCGYCLSHSCKSALPANQTLMAYLLFLSLAHGQSLLLGGTRSVCFCITTETDKAVGHLCHHTALLFQSKKSNKSAQWLGQTQHSKDALSQADSSLRKDVPGLVSSASPLEWLSACMSLCLLALWGAVLDYHYWPHIAVPSVWSESKQFRPIEKGTLDPFGHLSQLRISAWNELKMKFLFSAHLEPNTSQMRSVSDCGCNSCRSSTSLD